MSRLLIKFCNYWVNYSIQCAILYRKLFQNDLYKLRLQVTNPLIGSGKFCAQFVVQVFRDSLQQTNWSLPWTGSESPQMENSRKNNTYRHIRLKSWEIQWNLSNTECVQNVNLFTTEKNHPPGSAYGIYVQNICLTGVLLHLNRNRNYFGTCLWIYFVVLVIYFVYLYFSMCIQNPMLKYMYDIV